jgi:hypothetical protein
MISRTRTEATFDFMNIPKQTTARKLPEPSLSNLPEPMGLDPGIRRFIPSRRDQRAHLDDGSGFGFDTKWGVPTLQGPYRLRGDFIDEKEGDSTLDWSEEMGDYKQSVEAGGRVPNNLPPRVAGIDDMTDGEVRGLQEKQGEQGAPQGYEESWGESQDQNMEGQPNSTSILDTGINLLKAIDDEFAPQEERIRLLVEETAALPTPTQESRAVQKMTLAKLGDKLKNLSDRKAMAVERVGGKLYKETELEDRPQLNALIQSGLEPVNALKVLKDDKEAKALVDEARLRGLDPETFLQSALEEGILKPTTFGTLKLSPGASSKFREDFLEKKVGEPISYEPGKLSKLLKGAEEDRAALGIPETDEARAQARILDNKIAQLKGQLPEAGRGSEEDYITQQLTSRLESKGILTNQEDADLLSQAGTFLPTARVIDGKMELSNPKPDSKPSQLIFHGPDGAVLLPLTGETYKELMTMDGKEVERGWLRKNYDRLRSIGRYYPGNLVGKAVGLWDDGEDEASPGEELYRAYKGSIQDAKKSEKEKERRKKQLG